LKVKLPERGEDAESLIKELNDIVKNDMDPLSWRILSRPCGLEDKTLRDLGLKVYEMFVHKTIPDYNIFPSLLKIENEVVSMVLSLVKGSENSSGSFTSDCTEGMMLALEAAKDHFKKRRGVNEVPEIVLPITAHPCIIRASKYIGLKVRIASVDPETLKVDVDKVNEIINDKTAIMIGSAPNYPYGTVDDIPALSDLAEDRKVWLHVDACHGGFLLPFLKMLGEEVTDFDFELAGVSSISFDLSNYGCVPKGSSLVLYRSKEQRLGQIHVDLEWPGPPLIGTTILSSTSASSLVMTWITMKYLGIEGYKKVAARVLSAKRRIVVGLEGLGLRVLGEPESGVIAFTSEDVDLSLLFLTMRRKGWYLELQPGMDPKLPSALRLAISPAHDELTEDFLDDIREALDEVSRVKPPLEVELLKSARGFKKEEVMKEIPKILEFLGVGPGKLPENLEVILYNALKTLELDIVKEVLKHTLNEVKDP
jgi:sphinganine-1-phosphate aldolase